MVLQRARYDRLVPVSSVHGPLSAVDSGGNILPFALISAVMSERMFHNAQGAPTRVALGARPVRHAAARARRRAAARARAPAGRVLGIHIYRIQNILEFTEAQVYITVYTRAR